MKKRIRKLKDWINENKDFFQTLGNILLRTSLLAAIILTTCTLALYAAVPILIPSFVMLYTSYFISTAIFAITGITLYTFPSIINTIASKVLSFFHTNKPKDPSKPILNNSINNINQTLSINTQQQQHPKQHKQSNKTNPPKPNLTIYIVKSSLLSPSKLFHQSNQQTYSNPTIASSQRAIKIGTNRSCG